MEETGVEHSVGELLEVAVVAAVAIALVTFTTGNVDVTGEASGVL